MGAQVIRIFEEGTWIASQVLSGFVGGPGISNIRQRSPPELL